MGVDNAGDLAYLEKIMRQIAREEAKAEYDKREEEREYREWEEKMGDDL